MKTSTRSRTVAARTLARGNRTLLAAAVVGGIWTVLLIASASACATGLSRLDNLAAFAISIGCVGVIAGSAVRGGDGPRRAAQIAVGLLGGLYFGPSTGALLTIVLAGLGLREALQSRDRLLGIGLLVAGVVLGVLVTYGLLTRLLAPTDIRC
jgi:hypothetical protein